MKVKGFGKKYFSLVSVQAYSCSATLQRTTNAFKSLLISKLKIEKDDEDDIPKIDLLLSSCLSSINTPCHCDCFFRRKTALAVRLFKYIPRCPFYCTFFAFRRTGVHPPLSTF